MEKAARLERSLEERLGSYRFVRHLLERNARGWMFRFVADPQVEATNNRDERALRPMVIARKVSGGSRSNREAERNRISRPG